jgi:threonine dehydrogenase-like Zn-dependent dehydrogenase
VRPVTRRCSAKPRSTIRRWSGGLDFTPLITHRLPLTHWQEAVLAVANRRSTGSIKVLLDQRRVTDGT